MRYYLPCYDGFPSQMNQPGCCHIHELREVMAQYFHITVDVPLRSESILDLRLWLSDRLGVSPQNTQMNPESFELVATSVETDSRWCFSHSNTFLFKRSDDAIVFKLTWG